MGHLHTLMHSIRKAWVGKRRYAALCYVMMMYHGVVVWPLASCPKLCQLELANHPDAQVPAILPAKHPALHAKARPIWSTIGVRLDSRRRMEHRWDLMPHAVSAALLSSALAASQCKVPCVCFRAHVGADPPYRNLQHLMLVLLHGSAK